ncbi:alpha/beta fold hydrolase, partial [Algoriphagus aestuarii]|nr:alpha/beta fold hydrolase [Algoriphagus aestuarii]
TLEGFAQTLHAFVQAEGIRQVTVMAHSMGGQVALRLAKRAPETVQRLVLIAPSGYLRSAKRWQKIFFRLPFAYCVLPLLLTPQRIDKQLRSVY